MNILLTLIPVTVLVLIIAGVAFFWAVNHDQFDDLDTPSVLPLLDNPEVDQTPPASSDPSANKQAPDTSHST